MTQRHGVAPQPIDGGIAQRRTKLGPNRRSRGKAQCQQAVQQFAYAVYTANFNGFAQRNLT